MATASSDSETSSVPITPRRSPTRSPFSPHHKVAASKSRNDSVLITTYFFALIACCVATNIIWTMTFRDETSEQAVVVTDVANLDMSDVGSVDAVGHLTHIVLFKPESIGKEDTVSQTYMNLASIEYDVQHADVVDSMNTSVQLFGVTMDEISAIRALEQVHLQGAQPVSGKATAQDKILSRLQQSVAVEQILDLGTDAVERLGKVHSQGIDEAGVRELDSVISSFFVASESVLQQLWPQSDGKYALGNSISAVDALFQFVVRSRARIETLQPSCAKSEEETQTACEETPADSLGTLPPRVAKSVGELDRVSPPN